jgi:hypothetical protein
MSTKSSFVVESFVIIGSFDYDYTHKVGVGCEKMGDF